MFRRLDYQERVLSTLDNYLDALRGKKHESDEVAELAASKPHLNVQIPDYAEGAWEALKASRELPESRAEIPFSPRVDGCGRPVPNVVMKVPTGGGKTWLAVSAVSRILGRYLDRNTGFVLWVVPNEAIYTQTLKRLRDRRHPYRQALDRSAAGRVRVMEKSDTLNSHDVHNHLCVMLLMLQSSNRQNKETLKMFRDRGDVHGFFPPEGEQQAHAKALARTPNLDAYAGLFPMIKDSLGNALRMIRPVVILDEGHRAISDLAFETLYGFNPCFVLELTATPQDVQPRGGKKPRPGRYASVLVDVTGKELDREGMIKMPLNLATKSGNDWKATLSDALAALRSIGGEAGQFQADTGRYIRPIMLVQVERTGADQRDGSHIHAEDVRDWLLTAGLDSAEIAIKTAQQNDLTKPENQDLLLPTSRVRAVITKQALQEGWDCPFAYVLCSLAASSNLKAMTQLVGRILRQPHALKTGVQVLDECHVVAHHSDTAKVVEAIKDGLEQDGLGDLVIQTAQTEASVGSGTVTRKIPRRPKFAKTDVYLPRVLFSQGSTVRELDYETDVLSRIDWRGFNPATVAECIPENAQAAESQLQRIELSDDGDDLIVGELISTTPDRRTFDPAHAVRMITDIVQNPFVGREIVGRLLDGLRKRGFDEAKLGAFSSLILEELRRGLEKERDDMAEALFKERVTRGEIQFRLRLDDRNWRMPFDSDTTESESARQLLNSSGGPLQSSLFSPVYESELNGDEREVAVYLDGEMALHWWHRNVARSEYGIQGWRRAKIYPDFIFAVQGKGADRRITVLETKGDQLDNLDTAYKREVLRYLSEKFCWDEQTPAGELMMVRESADIRPKFTATLILMSEWRSKLPEYLQT